MMSAGKDFCAGSMSFVSLQPVLRSSVLPWRQLTASDWSSSLTIRWLWFNPWRGCRLPEPRAGEFEIQPSPENHPGDELAVAFDGSELKWLEFETDRRLEFSTQPITSQTPANRIVSLQGLDEEPVRIYQRTDGRSRIPVEPVDSIYVSNLGSSPASVKITWLTAPVFSEMAVVPVVALCVVAFYLFYLIFVAVAPKVSAISISTFKTEVSQPLYLLVLVLGILFIVGTIYLPYNTFGEDIKMYKDSGLTLIKVMAIFLAIWAASKSVAEEIEGRTALTVLSKPVGRRQFVLGKFAGISMAITVLFVILGLWFYIWVAYKPIYDYRESAKGDC